MQLSKLKDIYIKFSLSTNIQSKKRAEAIYELIQLYQSKYKNELSQDVGISLAAEELISVYKNSAEPYLNEKMSEFERCVIPYATQDDLNNIIKGFKFDKNTTLRSFYDYIKLNPIARRLKKEDILKFYDLQEVTFDSAKSNNS